MINPGRVAKKRDEFEKWLEAERPLWRNNPSHPSVELAWRAWQAAADTPRLTLAAKPLEWEGEEPEWNDADGLGFFIGFDLEHGPGCEYYASWGEGPEDSFGSLDEAKEWCQETIDSWVRERAMIAEAGTMIPIGSKVVFHSLFGERPGKVVGSVFRGYAYNIALDDGSHVSGVSEDRLDAVR